MQQQWTGRTVDLILRAAMGHPMTTAMYEGLCAGNGLWTVRGAAVCYMPTLDLLRRAARERKNLIISREHPFFLHGGLNYAYTTGGLEAALKEDPVVKAKQEIINANQIMVYRFGAVWDQYQPDAQSRALAKALGLIPNAAPLAQRRRGVVCDMPPATLTALAQAAATRLKALSCRTVGDARRSVTRVAVLAGETDPKEALAELLADPRIDGVIAGAGGVVDEVDGALAYFQDLISTGRKIALLAIGYGPSQEPGTAEMARWMRGVLPDLPLEFWHVTDAAWIPREVIG